MKLTQAIPEHLYPYFIVLHQHIMYIRWKPIQAWSGGLLLTSLCDGYNPFELENREFGWWLRFNGYLSAVANVLGIAEHCLRGHFRFPPAVQWDWHESFSSWVVQLHRREEHVS